MKKLFLFLLAILFSTSAYAQIGGGMIGSGGSSTFTGGTVTGATTFSSTVSLADGTAAAPTLRFTTEPTSGFYYVSAATLGVSILGTYRHIFDAGGIGVGYGSAFPHVTFTESSFGRDAANTFGFRSIVTPTLQQKVNIYNRYDSVLDWSVNYERMALTGVQGASVNITAETNGTGGDNLSIILTPAGTGNVQVPQGTATSPGLGFIGETNSGWRLVGAGTAGISLAGTDRYAFANGVFAGYSDTQAIWFGLASDLSISRDAANTLQMGVDAADNSAVTVTLKGPDSSTALAAGGIVNIVGGTGGAGGAVGAVKASSDALTFGTGTGPVVLTWAVTGTDPTLSVSAGSFMFPASTYLNFGSTAGTGGYGIFDSAGTLQFKDSGGTWASLSSLAPLASPVFTGTVTIPTLTVTTIGPVIFAGTVTAPVATITTLTKGPIIVGCVGYLKNDGSCDTPAGGGDVVGPASNTANGNVVLFNATTGKLVKDSTFTLAAPTVGAVLYATATTGWANLAAGASGAILMMSTEATPVPVFKNTVSGLTIGGFTASKALCSDGSGNAVACTNLLDIAAVAGPASPTTNQLVKFSTSGPTPLTNSTIVENGTDLNVQALNLVTTGTISGAIPSLSLSTSLSFANAVSPLTVATDRLVYGGIVEFVGTTGTIKLPTKVANMSLCLVNGSGTTVGVLLSATGSDLFQDEQTLTGAAGSVTLAVNTGAKVCVVGMNKANYWRVFSKGSNGVTLSAP